MMKFKKHLKDSSDSIFQTVCFVIIALQIGWLILHMSFHYMGIVDPWKMDGYAMYTTSITRYYAMVELENIENIEQHKERIIHDLTHYANGGCIAGISKRFYKKISIFKPDLLTMNEPLNLSFHKRQRYMLEEKYKNEQLGTATITLRENNKLEVQEIFCNQKRSFSVNVQQPLFKNET